MILNSFQHKRSLIKMKNNTIRQELNSFVPKNTIYSITDKSIAMQVIDDYVPIKNLLVKDKKKKKDEYNIELEDHSDSDSDDDIKEKVKEEYEEVENYETPDEEEEEKEEEEEEGEEEEDFRDLEDIETLQVNNIELEDLEKEMFGVPMEPETPKKDKPKEDELKKKDKPKGGGDPNVKTIMVKESFF